MSFKSLVWLVDEIASINRTTLELRISLQPQAFDPHLILSFIKPYLQWPGTQQLQIPGVVLGHVVTSLTTLKGTGISDDALCIPRRKLELLI